MTDPSDVNKFLQSVEVQNKFEAAYLALSHLHDVVMQEILPHLPTIAPKVDGSWGVFCWACTRAANDYTYPCQQTDGKSELWSTVPPELMPKSSLWVPDGERA
jgi:hypothetical protein